MSELWSDSQVLVASLLSSISGTLSIIGSSGIVYLIVSDWKNKISKVRNRILLGLSIFDIILSAALALATLPMPKGSPYAAWAIGNSATCTAQGFFIQVGLASLLYNGCLAIYHFLVIHYKKQDRWIRYNIERYLHIAPISFCFITAVISASLDQFHHAGNMCYLASFPYQCHLDDNVDCIRGENTTIYRGMFALLPVLLSFITVVVSMGCIVLGVHRQEKRLKQYDFESRVKKQSRQSSEPSDKTCSRMAKIALPKARTIRTRETYIQALLYSGSFFTVIIFQIIALFAELTNENGHIPFGIASTCYFLRPFQGFFNFLIFIRPNYIKGKRGRKRARRSDDIEENNDISAGSLPTNRTNSTIATS